MYAARPSTKYPELYVKLPRTLIEQLLKSIPSCTAMFPLERKFCMNPIARLAASE